MEKISLEIGTAMAYNRFIQSRRRRNMNMLEAAEFYGDFSELWKLVEAEVFEDFEDVPQ